MPDISWNKHWALDLRRFLSRKKSGYYGLQWGDPSISGWRYWMEKLKKGNRLPGNLSKVAELYIKPYVSPQTIALEIGSGGGRWTAFLLPVKEIIVVELNPEFFSYIRERFPKDAHKIKFYKTSGYELDGIPEDSVEYVFSFGTFVHIEIEGIDLYLKHLERVMKIGAVGVIHYSDKTKKFFKKAQNLPLSGFSDVNPRHMERSVQRCNFEIVEHNVHLLNHSNIVVFRRTEDRN